MGLGNVDCGDDGFGVRLAEALAARRRARTWSSPAPRPSAASAACADEGFDHLVFLDAVEFGGAPGSVVFLDAREMAARFPQISTHKISLGLLAQVRWKPNGTTRAWLLGVQPASLKPGGALTPAVQTTLDLLAELLRDLATRRAAHAADVNA